MPDTKWSAWAKRHAVPVRAVSFVVASVAIGYVWAATFGDGVHGLQDTAQLDHSSSFPDANVALIAALILFLGASVLASGMTGNWESPARSSDGGSAQRSQRERCYSRSVAHSSERRS